MDIQVFLSVNDLEMSDRWPGPYRRAREKHSKVLVTIGKYLHGIVEVIRVVDKPGFLA